MSVVAVKKYKDKIVIGSDSIIVSSDWSTKRTDKDGKLMTLKNGMTLGVVGDCSAHTLFIDFLEDHMPKRNTVDAYIRMLAKFWKEVKDIDDSIDMTDFEAIIVYKGKVFELEDFYIHEVKDYTAIGAGESYALTALHLGKTIKEAIRVTCQTTVWCCEPIKIIEIKI